MLLIIIYLAFISLGLPDSLLGSSWTVMHIDMGASIEFAGIISMIIFGGTIISSLLASRVIQRFKTGKVVAVSVAMTAIALFGFSISTSVWMLILFAIPLGLGAGAVDAALNNFVALHYKAHHMSWLHCFWGIGATGGPLILAFFLGNNGSWRSGYSIIGTIQVVLVVVLIVTLPMWKNVGSNIAEKHEEQDEFISNRMAIKIKGVKFALLTFLCYCALEASTGLWAASYLTTIRGTSPHKAALWVSFYFGGITVGRFLSGVIANKVKGEDQIRGGVIIIAVGVMLLTFNLSQNICMIGLILIGLGCAPIYPSMIHLTPQRFGKKASQSIIGLSMAFAYIGSTFVPPILGAVSSALSLKIFPYALIIFIIGMLVASEILCKRPKYEQ